MIAGLTLADLYLGATILGIGYVVLSIALGGLHFSDLAGSHDAGLGGHDGGLGGHDGGVGGHDGVDASAGDMGPDSGAGGHAATHDRGTMIDATDERRRAFTPCSPTIIATFLGVSGVIGLVLLRGYGWEHMSLIPASLGGLATAGGFMAMFNKLAEATAGSTHAVTRDLIGLGAEVTTPIGGDSIGEITFVVKGVRLSHGARSANGEPLGRGMAVTIEAVDGNDLYVLRK